LRRRSPAGWTSGDAKTRRASASRASGRPERRLSQRTQARTSSLARLGHDLRHPLAGVRGVLAAGSDAEHRGRVLDLARRQVEQVAERGDGDPVLSVSLPPERLELDADPARQEQMVATLHESVARDSEPGSRIEILVDHGGRGGGAARAQSRDDPGPAATSASGRRSCGSSSSCTAGASTGWARGEALSSAQARYFVRVATRPPVV